MIFVKGVNTLRRTIRFGMINDGLSDSEIKLCMSHLNPEITQYYNDGITKVEDNGTTRTGYCLSKRSNCTSEIKDNCSNCENFHV